VRSVSAIAKRGGERRLDVLRPVAVAACVCLLGAGAAGCSTTQEKAAAKQLEADKILKARAKRQAAKKHEKTKHDHGKQKGKGK
jgi:hypothetical protein